MPAETGLESARSAVRRRFLALAVLLCGLGATFGGSSLTGPTFDEERRVAAVRHATELARAFRGFGPSTMVSSSARGIYDDLAPFGVLPGLLSGWLGEVLREAHLLGALTASRFGFLLVTGLAPFAVYALAERSRGARVGLLAAAFLVATPRFFHGASAAREPVIVASLWTLVLAAYAMALPPRAADRRRGADRSGRPGSVLFAVALGTGAAIDLATLWILPAVVLHSFLRQRGAVIAALRRGRAPLPAALLVGVVLSPGVFLLSAPQLWRGGALSLADLLFAPLAPTIEQIPGAAVATFRDVPAGHAARYLAVTTPVVLLLLAALGAGVFVRDALASRRGERPRDPVALGALCCLLLAAVVFGPAMTPRPFVRFPPRVEGALPFLAILAAVGLERVATRVVGERRAVWAVSGSALIAVVAGFAGVPTASASVNLVGRALRGAPENRAFLVGDGSEVAPLARAIDALGQRSVPPPSGDVPRTYFQLLAETGRMRTAIEPRGSSSLSVSRGTRASPLATVERDGAVLWSLQRR